MAKETTFPLVTLTFGLILETKCSPDPVPPIAIGLGLLPRAFTLFAANLMLLESISIT